MVTTPAKIAIYVHELAQTGVVRNTAIAAAALKAGGHEVEIVTALGGGTVPEGIRHVVLLERAGRSRGLEHLAAIAPLRRYLRETRPAIAVSAGNHGHAVLWTASRGNHEARRVYRISNDLRREIAGAPRSSRFRRWARRRFTRMLVGDCTQLVLVAEELLADPILAAAYAAGKAEIILNGIDVAAARRFAAEPLEHPWLDGSAPTVITVGRLAAQKNLFALLEALAKLRSRCPARLIILGQSRDDMGERLARRARELAVDRHVLLAGTTDNVFAWLARADVFAFPSWWEGFPNALLEAMAVGLPVVASRSAGSAARVVGDDFGCLVDPRDPGQIADALEKQLDPNRRILPGSRAEDFDVSRTVFGWQALGRRLLGAPVR